MYLRVNAHRPFLIILCKHPLPFSASHEFQAPMGTYSGEYGRWSGGQVVCCVVLGLRQVKGGTRCYNVFIVSMPQIFGTVGRSNTMSWHEDNSYRPTSSPEVQLLLPSNPPRLSQDMEDVRVHRNRSYMVHVEARRDETAEDILEKACEQLVLRPENSQLCELRSDGGECTTVRSAGYVRVQYSSK